MWKCNRSFTCLRNRRPCMLEPLGHGLNVDSSTVWHFPSLHLSMSAVLPDNKASSNHPLFFFFLAGCRFHDCPQCLVHDWLCNRYETSNRARCVCRTMTGWQSQAVCGRTLTPGGEERLLIATHLAFRWFEVLIRGWEERALQVRGPIKFIIDELEWLTGGRSGRKFLFGGTLVGVLLIYSSLLYTKSHFTSS